MMNDYSHPPRRRSPRISTQAQTPACVQQAGGNSVRRSKLHLVDLAGSERIKRTGIQGGALLRESKHINLSLHFLEQVIVALQVQVLVSPVPRCVCWKQGAVRSEVCRSCTLGVQSTSACPSTSWSRSSSPCRCTSAEVACAELERGGLG